MLTSKTPQLYTSYVLPSLTMVANDSAGILSPINPQSVYVSCKAEMYNRFHTSCHYCNGIFSSDFLPSHASWRFQADNGLKVADKAITSMCNSRLTRLPGYIARVCWWCVSRLLKGSSRALGELSKSMTRTTQSAVWEMSEKGALEANFLQALIKASETMGTPEPLFADNTIEALSEFHWGLYGQSMHTRALQFFAAQLFLFTLLIAMFRDLCATGGSKLVLAWVLQGILFTMIIYAVWQEKHIAKVTKSYYHLRNPWTAMSLVASLLVVSGQLVNVILGVPNLGVDVVNAFAAVLMWFSLLYYLLPYRSTGPLVRMILMIISDIKAFLMILFIVIIGFAAAFYSIVGFSSSTKCDMTTASYCVDVQQDASAGSYSTPGLALRTSFSTLFGGYDLQEMDDNPAPIVLSLLWVAFMVIVSIVLLNILIAIISDSFERLIEGSKAAWLLGKAKTTMKMHALLSDKSKTELAEYMKDKEVLYVLMPKADGCSSNSADWNGRVSAIVNRVKENSNDVSTEVSSIGNEIRDMRSEMKDRNSDISHLRTQFKQLVDTLRHRSSKVSDIQSECNEATGLKNIVESPVETSKYQNTEISDMRSEVSNVRTQVSSINSEIKDIRNVIEGLVETSKHQNSEVTYMKDEVASMKGTLQEILEALNRLSTVPS